MQDFKNFPRQKLSFSQKSIPWRKSVLDWADNKSYFSDTAIRKSVKNKTINLNLYTGTVDITDMKLVLNPADIDQSLIPEGIQHFPRVAPIIDTLVGEEAKRRFDFKIVVSNPNAISEKENQQKEVIVKKLESLLSSEEKDPNKIKKSLENLQYFAQYEWQDMRELRANYLINHYSKELDLKIKFNRGFKNALILGEEAYIVSIVQDEPHVELLNPKKLHVLRNGYSTRIEDADIIIYADYWSPGRIIDTYYTELKAKDIEWLEGISSTGSTNEMGDYDETEGFVRRSEVDSSTAEGFFNSIGDANTNFTDSYGNVRILRMWWKSKRKILKVKSYDKETGEEIFDFYPETYVINEALGEESTVYWINESWHGLKIGPKIYADIKPLPVQFNRISNPSKCHFGIIGEFYNTNETKVVSLMDRLKPYQYLYDATHAKLGELLALNWGIIAEIDIAKIPNEWKTEEWMYYMKTLKVAFVDSFKEATKGAATGKLAGSFNTLGGRTMNMDQGNAIQQHINTLSWIENQIATLSGVSRQREGNISSSETLGGVERAISQSSNTTEEIFMIHDSVKKRVLEALLEVSKIALKKNKKKLQYIADDGSAAIFEIDGEQYAECDYGIIVDNSSANIELNQKFDQLAHAALQNQTLSFSSILSIYTDPSMSSIRRKIEIDEKNRIVQAQEQAQAQQKQAEEDLKERQRQFNTLQEWEREKFFTTEENKIYIAELQADVAIESKDTETSENKNKIDEKKLDLDKESLSLEKKKHSDEMNFKHKELIEKMALRQSKKSSK